MTLLNVNIDHVATIREARKTTEPDPILAAFLAEMAGADGIVVHLREDRRHIQDRDLEILRKTVKTKLNLEMAPTSDMVEIALISRPDMVTIVPEKRLEITTEGGLDILGNKSTVESVVSRLKNNGLVVSIFIDPDKRQIKAAKDIEADIVEIHTGVYANSNDKDKEKELKKIIDSVQKSLSLDLKVSAGHGLTYNNVRNVAQIKGIEELNIGHSIISAAVFGGMEKAVRDMINLCR